MEDKKVRILLVEDYGPTQIFLKEALEAQALVVVEIAKDGNEALVRARDGSFSLVIIDTQMPVMNGPDAIELIRKIPKYELIPIVSMTAFPETDLELCLSAGATDWIKKPIEKEPFIEKVKWLLNHPP